jgi:hypothetical protein
MSTLVLSTIKWLACFLLASTSIHAFGSGKYCPGNVASLHYRLANRHQMMVDVLVNQSGPFSFLFDTGTQMTMVDPSLASELHLSEEGSAAVASVGVNAQASFAHVDRIAAGSHSLPDLKVLVYDLSNLQVDGVNIRGVLGEDFLERFDMLIDNAHNLLCLDDRGAMRTQVKGQHIPLLAPSVSNDGTLPNSLIVQARLSDGMRPVRLKIDSGANVSFLYNAPECVALGASPGASLRGGGANGTQRVFTALPLQKVKIGPVEMPGVQFVTLAGAKKNPYASDFDGLLTTGLFRRIFIDHTDHFAVLDPL